MLNKEKNPETLYYNIYKEVQIGDVYYDIAKLRHSYHGMYDAIIDGLYTLERKSKNDFRGLLTQTKQRTYSLLNCFFVLCYKYTYINTLLFGCLNHQSLRLFFCFYKNLASYFLKRSQGEILN